MFGMIAALAACDPVSPVDTSSTPQARPASPITTPTPAVRLGPVAPSARSQELATYYQRLQNDLLVQGLLRTDGGGPDTPYNSRQLTENFVRIALFDEYVTTGNTLRAEATESRLRRWDQTVRMSIEFGASVPRAQRAVDTAFVRDYSKRLSRITGLAIQPSDAERANFHVLVLNEDDRRGYRSRLSQIAPRLSQSSVNAFLNMRRNTLCLLLANTTVDETPTYTNAVAVIRAEEPDLMRQGCFHEEIAQGLGLANDSPAARPSIFNDDEEFGLLTTHDEMLLRILYDPRMRPGMTVPQALPVARQIATDLLGGPA